MQTATNNRLTTGAVHNGFSINYGMNTRPQFPFMSYHIGVLGTAPQSKASTRADNAARQAPVIYAALEKETRTHVGTACAAYWMNRKPQTLRAWACFEDGPIRPVRVNGRLAWAVEDIRRVMAVGGQK